MMNLHSGQNTSSAVMQSRHEPADSLDDFPTPPWATRALCEWLKDSGLKLAWRTCREPSANRGHMVRPLEEYFHTVDALDVHDYGTGYPVRDFLAPEPLGMVNFSITNPPFRLAQQFIHRMHQTSEDGYAVLVRTSFLEGVGRHRALFSLNQPTHVLQFAERVVMHKGRLAPKGSTATSYCWLVWLKDEADSVTQFNWIGPCRKRLEKEGDYP
jgi:hypothetical protein